MYYPKHIHGPAFQLSKSPSAELYSEHSVSVPAPLKANELHQRLFGEPCLLHYSQGEEAPYANGSMR